MSCILGNVEKVILSCEELIGLLLVLEIKITSYFVINYRLHIRNITKKNIDTVKYIYIYIYMTLIHLRDTTQVA